MKRLTIICLTSLTCLTGRTFAANEINAFAPGVTTAYAVIRQADGDVWYPTGQVFEVWGTGARTAADYDIALTDKSGDMFVGNFDTNVAAQFCHLVTHYQAGAGPADTDPVIWQEYGYWSGTAWQVTTMTAATIADTLWDEAIADHTGETTFGGELGTLDPNITLIKAKTDLISAQVITANAAYMHNPLIDQNDIVVAQVGLIKNKPSAAAIQIAEITTPGLIKVWRYRKGTDTTWTVIVNGGGMGAGIGSIYYTYTFPSATWADGDLILYEIYNTVVEVDGEVFTLSTVQGFGVIGDTASVAAIKAVTDIMQALNTTVSVADDANSFTLTDGNDVNDFYVGMTIYVKDATTGDWASKVISDWETGGVVTVDSPLAFIPEAGDIVVVWGLAHFPIDVLEEVYLPPDGETITVDTRASVGAGGTTGGTRTLDVDDEDPP